MPWEQSRAATVPAATNNPATSELPFRQIHLDFHTSELIPDVAVDFETRQFVDTLQAARVNSINLFAKCHHGWAYYDTKVAHKHPHLRRDLLADQVAALRAAGIAVNYYYSLVWDVRTSRAHPEWMARNRDGSTLHSGYWPWMCMNTPYLEQTLRENAEIQERFAVNGGWWDILIQPPNGCWCTWCVADRKQLGLTGSDQDIYRHNKIVALRVEKAHFEQLRAKQPEANSYFNSRLVVGFSDELTYNTHIDIESLPTGGWGYTHFEQRVRYCRTLSRQMVGATGRFHKSWGDFGGFKNQAALNFECLNFLANGARACIGDQLHPRGKLDPMTYGRVAKTYALVEQIEPHVRGTRGVADIGVMSVAATDPNMKAASLPDADEGITNMLVELHQQFDVLDLTANLSKYKVVILPDDIRPVPVLVEAVSQYLAGDGRLIVSYKSLFDPEKNGFALEAMGIDYQGPAKYRGEYLLPKRAAFPDVPENAYYLYQEGLSISAREATEVLAIYGHPYFDRSPEHWCSHAQTPFDRATDEPVITRRGRVVYIANPFFRSYAQDADPVQKQLVRQLLTMLLPEPAIRADGVPSTARLTLSESTSGDRQLVQILYAPYERRARNIDIIEEPASFANAIVYVRRPRRPKQVRVVDFSGRESSAAFGYENGYVKVGLPLVTGQIAFAVEA